MSNPATAARLVARLNQYWANRSFRIKAMALLFVPLPVLIGAAAALYRVQQNEQQARAWVQHTQDVRSSIQETQIQLLDAEASARDFLLTGEPSALSRYGESKQSLASLAQELAPLVADSPSQFRRATEVHQLIQDELAALSTLCQNRSPADQQSSAETGRFVLLAGGRDVAAQARLKLAAMQMEEDRLLEERSHRVESARWRLFMVLLESAAVGLFFQMIAALLLTGTISSQIRALERRAQFVGKGVPPQDILPDTREVMDLAQQLEQAAILLADHEHALRESEERFRALFKDAPIAYHEIDREGVVRHVNSAECTLLGRQTTQIVGKHAWELVPLESQELVRRNVLERIAGARPTTPYECDFECQDQSLVTVEVHENLIRDKQGVTIGLRSALLDVTARKMVNMAVKKVEQYAQELKTKNEELLLALRTAREASATKGRFLAAMSHELRTPLNGIIGLAELMFDGVAGLVSDEQREYLGDILASSRHLLELVNDVLDLAKVESGKMEFRRDPIEVEPLLREVRDVLRILAEKKRIPIKIDTGNVDMVITDPARLKQVVYNYLSNAIKFTGEGGSIHVRARWEGGRAFRIEVEDNGPGIREADIARLFSDFQQLDSARPGSGLGLALTKCIVESQGGVVGVRSTPGVGSLFFAVLPIEFPTDRSSSVSGGERLFGSTPRTRFPTATLPAHVPAPRGRSVAEALPV